MNFTSATFTKTINGFNPKESPMAILAILYKALNKISRMSL